MRQLCTQSVVLLDLWIHKVESFPPVAFVSKGKLCFICFMYQDVEVSRRISATGLFSGSAGAK